MGRYKVYLIDEVHMFSSSSFNAMLKTLEEPPPHAVFLLATTDVQKVLPTVLSRCLQLTPEAGARPSLIGAHLADVLGREGIAFEPDSLEEIARCARGSIRDGMTLTDQAINYTNGNLQAGPVRAMLGALDRGVVAELAAALACGDAGRALDLSGQIAAGGDFLQGLEDLMGLLHQAALVQLTGAGIDPASPHRQAAAELSKTVAPEMLQLLYQIALLGRRDLELASDLRQGFEMLLLRMLAFTPHAGQALASPAPAAEPPGPAPKPEPAPASAPAAASAPAPAPASAPAAESAPAPQPAAESGPAPGPRPAAEPSAPDAAPAAAPQPEPRAVRAPDAAPPGASPAGVDRQRRIAELKQTPVVRTLTERFGLGDEHIRLPDDDGGGA